MIIGVVVGAVIGSRHSDSSSSVTADSTMTANQRHIGAATMNITGSMTTNVQVVYQDLETTDLLYRLVWDDQAAPEQRILSLDPSPQQKTPIAVTSANTTSNDGVVTDVFYLSANKDNSSLSDICHVTMQCALGAENCTVSASVIISDGALQGVLNNSGLAAALLPGSSAIRVYYKNGGRAIRSLVGNSTANNSWGDSYVGSQAVPHSSISVNVDQNEDTTLQVVFVNLISKEMEEITYSDAAGVGTNTGKEASRDFLSSFGSRLTSDVATASIVTSSAPPGWKPAARFSTCFQPGLNQHHIYYVDSTGDIHGLFRGDSSVNWTLTQLTKGTAVGGVASVAWDSQVRLLYMAGDPLTLSMSANNNSVWSNVQAL